MTSRISTILVVGGTGGLGEGFARRFHALGKKVIITGRREDRLQQLKQELPGVETIQWDMAQISSIPTKVKEILAAHPTLDTVFLNAGIQKAFSFFDPSTSSDDAIIEETNINLTAPTIAVRHFLPHLAALAQTRKPANLILTSSGLAYIPFGFYPVYCSTKAAIHSFCLVLRQQQASASTEVKENLSIVELAPPYVDTGLDTNHREFVNGLLGDKATPPMALKEYLDSSMSSLEETENGKLKKEIGVGFSALGIQTWRGSFGKAMEGMGIDC